jgi:hypothetical protein
MQHMLIKRSLWHMREPGKEKVADPVCIMFREEMYMLAT